MHKTIYLGWTNNINWTITDPEETGRTETETWNFTLSREQTLDVGWRHFSLQTGSIPMQKDREHFMIRITTT